MSFHHRITTVYWKELVDILRDHRTLIAMIVVPIVLYPLLMLGSIQAVSFQAEAMGREAIRIGVTSEHDGWRLARMIDADTTALEQQRRNLDPESQEAESLPEPLDNAKTVLCDSRRQLEQRLTERQIQVGVIFDNEHLVGIEEYTRQVQVELLADLEEVRSASAKRRIEALISRVNERLRNGRLARESLPHAFFEPFVVTTVDLSAPPSILGQVLPLILILMTITGAIYPAIDLTAGERERGTLESLMVSPVPVIDLIVGKFLVVTTVAILGAALNLASVAATVYFGGFQRIIARAGEGLPIGKMALILLCLIPFAVLMSAIMIAVCSYARTFKEAQNYVTPVILAVLIPGGIAALPATRLEGFMLVVPVGNMVLLARNFLLGAAVPIWHIAVVLLSTSFYAAAAVAVAANVFGRESVVFADAESLKANLLRRMIRPSSRPSVSMGLLFVALLFPAWFFVQSVFSPAPGGDASDLLWATGWLMPALFVLLPLGVLVYWKVDVARSLALRMPTARHLGAGILLGVSAWVPAHELNVIQEQIVGAPQAVLESTETMVRTVRALPIESVYVLLALVPAICEELLFRGFLLNSLMSARRPGEHECHISRATAWKAIIAAAVVFGVFHFFVFKLLVTVSLGVLLGYLCWQSQSILPPMIAHLLHNAIGVTNVLFGERFPWQAGEQRHEWDHLPTMVLLVGGLTFVVGLLLIGNDGKAAPERSVPTAAEP